jgi:hypothetical protein
MGGKRRNNNNWKTIEKPNRPNDIFTMNNGRGALNGAR